MTLGEFETFLHSHIKVDGKAGNLGTKIKLGKDKTKVLIEAELPFSKGYIKYLTKKFLKKKVLRNYLRVVATTKDGFTMRYFKNSTSAEA
jgi:large subunit ribosomal protein L22e